MMMMMTIIIITLYIPVTTLYCGTLLLLLTVAPLSYTLHTTLSSPRSMAVSTPIY